MPDLTISIVTYNSASCLPGLLESLEKQAGVSWELRIADNGSTDGTLEQLAGLRDAQVIRNAANLGFGQAHNQNLRDAEGRFLLLLNPDLRIEDGLFRQLVQWLDAHPRLGIAGPQVLEGGDRRLFAPRQFYPGEGMIGLEPQLERTGYRWINGSCMAIRRDAFRQVGGFDADFFLYSEEADLCLRLRRAGWEVGWQREATVHHAGFGSQAAAGEYQRARTMLEGMAVFYQKHYSREAVRSMMRFQLAAIPFVSLFTRPGLAPRHPLYRERLQARRDVAREWLARAGAGAFPIDGWTPRILARQLRLAWAWLRQGRFPLDDY